MDPRTSLGGAFWRYWWAATISASGNGMLVIALPLLAAAHTANPLYVALVMAADRLPWLLFGLQAGALADRHASRPLLIGADLARLGVLALLGVLVCFAHPALPELLATAFLVGAGGVVFDCAAQAWLPRTVAGPALGRANGYLGVTQAAQVSGGSALGGLAVAAAPALPLLADAGTFAVSALLLRRLPPGPPRRSRPAPIRTEVRAGLAYLRGDRFTALLALLLTALAGLQAGGLAVQPLLGLRVFGLTDGQYGVLVGVAALGGLAGTLLAARYVRIDRTGILAGAIGAAALGYLGIATTTDPWLGGAALAVENLGVAVGSAALVTLRMNAVPAELQGRIAAVFRILLYTAVTAGTLLGGVVARAFGLHAPFLVAAGGYLVLLVALVPWLAAHVPAETDPAT